jgi:hypothetical protein
LLIVDSQWHIPELRDKGIEQDQASATSGALLPSNKKRRIARKCHCEKLTLFPYIFLPISSWRFILVPFSKLS